MLTGVTCRFLALSRPAVTVPLGTVIPRGSPSVLAREWHGRYREGAVGIPAETPGGSGHPYRAVRRSVGRLLRQGVSVAAAERSAG